MSYRIYWYSDDKWEPMSEVFYSFEESVRAFVSYKNIFPLSEYKIVEE